MVADSENPVLLDGKNSQERSGRRRRIMSFKLSFRKKKKGRFELVDDSNSHGSSLEIKKKVKVVQVEEKNAQSLENCRRVSLPNSSKEERPKGFINKLFSFKKSKRKSCGNVDFNPGVRTKSQDLQHVDPIIIDKLQNGMVSLQNDGVLASAGLGASNCVKQTAETQKSHRGEQNPVFSLSSPNLAFVECASAESFMEGEIENRKHGSLRRSRASLVFPVSEIGSNVFGNLQHTVSERNIPCRHTANRVRHSQSCLPLNDSSVFGTNHSFNNGNDEISFARNKDVINNNSLHRTPDGRSPYPGKRLCHEAFSLPGIFEDDPRKSLHADESQILIKDIELANIDSKENLNDSRIQWKSLNKLPDRSDTNNDVFDGSESISSSAKIRNNKQNNTRMYGRYTSCPGIFENSDDVFLPNENPAPSQGYTVEMRKLPQKPYSPHMRPARPYSMHEGTISAQSFKTYESDKVVSFGDYEMTEDQCSPPEDVLTLPSRDLPLAFAEALWDHSGVLKTELTFRAGEMIAVYFMNNQHWWWGTKDDIKGWFPSSHVRLLVDQQLEDSNKDGETRVSRGGRTIPLPRRNTLSLLGLQDNLRTEQDVRSRCVLELVTSEKDYVKTLRDVTEGYLKQARKKPDMFKQEDINIVFCNIEQIYKFHRKFYQDILKKIDRKEMNKSQVADLFVLNSAEFEIYSQYCNNHPTACARLLELQKEKRYRLFFESCRLLQQMISLSIDAFLLTPVQKICKYPLQLNELLKHTPADHADHEPLQAAVQVMRDVASSINERKRKFENLNSLAEWQVNVQAWQGDDVLEESSELIKSGLIERLNGLKLEEIHLSLFDHQLIICKKDSYKKNSRLTYLERVNLDHASVESYEEVSGQNTQYFLKVVDDLENVVHLLITRTVEERDKWLKALMTERQVVKNDKKIGHAIPKPIRLAAMESAKNKKLSESKKEHRRRKSLTDPFQGLETGANVIRRSFRLRRTQSLRDKKNPKGQ